MAIAEIDGRQIAYEVVGEGEPWILTPGGRFPKETPGLPQMAEELAKAGRQAILWDRPNCGGSELNFTGESESVVQADALAGLLKHLGVGPAMIHGGSGGARVSLLAAQRHPEVCKGLTMNWITGSTYGLLILAQVYTFPSYFAAFTGGMEAVAELEDWQEAIEHNQRNRDVILSQKRDAFLATMDSWMRAYCPTAGVLIPGVTDDELRVFDRPTLVFNSGHSDPHHPRAMTEAVADLLPNASLVDPPWGDREWLERGEDNAENGNGLFRRWPLLLPQLLDFEASIS
jgi:pimeloyl-ACP methyl ester carboxylesterase